MLSLDLISPACKQCEVKSGEPLTVVGIILFSRPGLNSGLSAILVKGPGIEATLQLREIKLKFCKVVPMKGCFIANG